MIESVRITQLINFYMPFLPTSRSCKIQAGFTFLQLIVTLIELKRGKKGGKRAHTYKTMAWLTLFSLVSWVISAFVLADLIKISLRSSVEDLLVELDGLLEQGCFDPVLSTIRLQTEPRTLYPITVCMIIQGFVWLAILITSCNLIVVRQCHLLIRDYRGLSIKFADFDKDAEARKKKYSQAK